MSRKVSSRTAEYRSGSMDAKNACDPEVDIGLRVEVGDRKSAYEIDGQLQVYRGTDCATPCMLLVDQVTVTLSVCDCSAAFHQNKIE
jgi:hypothetical protein